MKRVMMLGFVMLFLAAVLWTSAPLTSSAQAAPAMPASFQVSSFSASQINLSWSAVSGATSYQVYRSTGTSTSYSKIATVTTLSYKNTGLTAATRYNYKVRAVQGSTPGSFTAVKSAYTRPAVPAGLAAKTISTTQIDLSWTAVTGATSYQVYRSTGTSTTYAKIATVTSLKYSNKGCAVGTRYNYKILAANAGGTGAFSAVKTAYTKPAAPTGVIASKVSETQINLKWAKVTGATGYKIYVSKNGSAFAYQTTTTSLTFSHTSLTAGGYSYKVAAVAGTSEGAQSAASAKVFVGGPAPTGLKATTASTSQINLTWNAVSGAQYIVSRSVGSSTAYSAIRTVNTTSFNDITLTSGVKYNYRVQALTGSLTSAYSATASAYTKPLAPTSFAATRASNTQIHLTWSMPTACTGYKLYVSVNGGSYTYLASVAVSTRQYDHSGLAAGTYQYRVTAVAGSIESAPTTSASLVLPQPGLPAPTWVSATTAGYDSIKLVWNDVDGAIKFKIYISLSATSGYSYFDEWVGTECYANGLNPNTVYYFQLSAVDANGKEGARSTYKGATTAPAPPKPAKPTFTCTGGENNGVIYFKPNTTAYYKVYDSTNGINWTQIQMNGSYDAVRIDSYYGMSYVADVVGQSIYVRFVAVDGPSQSDPDDHYFAALGMPQFSSRKTYWDLVIGHTGAIDLFWNAVPGASGYRIIVKDLQGNTIRSTTWTATSIRFTNMPSYVTLNYYIVAYNSQGVSGPIYNMTPISIVGESGGW